MESLRFCALPDHIETEGLLCRFPDGKVTWCITDELPGVPLDHFQKALAWGWAMWEAIAGVKAEYVESASRARVLIGSRRIDGPAGILAETELPCGNVAQVRMWFDTGDAWTDQMAHPERLIILPDVAWHEQGHALGIGHAAQGSNNIMAPIYNPDVKAAGAWDIAEATRRYGPPVVVVPTDPGPVTPTTPTGVNLMNVLKFLGAFLQQPWVLAFLEQLAKKYSQPGGAVTAPLTADQFMAELAEFKQNQP